MRDSKLPKRQYTDEFKIEAIRLAESVGGHEAARRLGVPVSNLGNWSRRRQSSDATTLEAADATAAMLARRPVSELEAENSRLRRELTDAKLDVEILRKATAYFCIAGRDEVRLGIENRRDGYTVSRLCRVLSVSRTGYCQWHVRAPSARALANEVLDAKVAIIHRDSRKSYGRPRITQQLHQQGECVSAERVRHSLKRQGLCPVYRKRPVIPPLKVVA